MALGDITIGPLTISADLQWIDEFADGSDLVGQVVTTSIRGAQIVQASAQQAGRRVTLQGRLEGNAGFGVVTRGEIEQLRALAAVPAAIYPLTLGDGRMFTCMFRRSDGPAVEAESLRHIVPPEPGDLCFPTIRLMLV